MQDIGRLLLFAGLILCAAGAAVLLFGRLGIPLGRLPGDIVIRRGNSTFYFPWVTCILVSVVLTFIMALFRR